MTGGPTHRARARALTAGTVAGALALAAALAGDAYASRRVRSDPEALRLLRAAADAARRVPFDGRQFLTTRNRSGSTTSTLRVAHRPGDGTYFDPGPQAPALRTRGTSAEVRSLPSYRPDDPTAFTAAALSLLAGNYALRRGDASTVCGRRARIVEARRPDGTAAGRFWIDDDTGLMLRRELMDAHGRPVSSSGFSEVRVSRPADGRDAVAFSGSAPSRPAAAPWSDRLEAAELAELRERGWRFPDTLPGSLALRDARRPSPDDGSIHLSYTDGLAAVSVFVQRGGLDEGRLAGWRRSTVAGRTVYRRDSLQHWLVWSGNGQVYTVMTDGPADRVESVVKGLPGGGSGFWGRLGRGFRRLGSWVNPFA
ncbi:sigma-E factor regulatory protein RseB domain-containing protein [Spirillospora sp. CA-294931]|uniref:sigma-E factor regulatory protein RseB domain-containing protein n=1 Tax=Spirillospora sp. CA-294931 TaxID=3240042 RepID=UPI003D8C03C8